MPNGMKRAFTGVALVLICYSLLGFLILPGIAQRIANQQLAAYATVPASLQRIEFNPFSLELSLFGLRIGEQDDRQLAFERLFLDLQWDSLWQRAAPGQCRAYRAGRRGALRRRWHAQSQPAVRGA